MASELKILKVKVKNLHFENATKDFFNSNLQNKAGVAAIGAAAVGAFAASTVLTSVSGSARDRDRDRVQVFNCTVKGVELSGCFKAITFKEGDKIEFVVEYNPDNPEEAAVHAARDTKKKLLWVLPYQGRGEIVYKEGSLKFITGISLFISIGYLLLTLCIEWSNNFKNMDQFDITVWISIGGGISLFLLMMIGRQKEIPHTIKATKVFAALGYKNPAHVDAEDNTIDAEIAYQKIHGKTDDYLDTWINRYQDSDLEK